MCKDGTTYLKQLNVYIQDEIVIQYWHHMYHDYEDNEDDEGISQENIVSFDELDKFYAIMQRYVKTGMMTKCAIRN